MESIVKKVFLASSENFENCYIFSPSIEKKKNIGGILVSFAILMYGMQMMSDAREGLISRIIVKKYDRFSRNMREYLNITDELDRYGVTVYSLSEPFNTETKEDKIPKWVVS